MIEGSGAEEVLTRLVMERVRYVTQITVADPVNLKFLQGWVNRCHRNYWVALYSSRARNES